MTIMLLPHDKALIFGADRLGPDDIRNLIDFVNRWMAGRDPVAAINHSVNLVIDARVEPAIAIEVPK